MSEKLCLQWNDFKENAVKTFGSLREDKDFTDVTLVCEDGEQLEAHKVVLASSSPFFNKILSTNKHIHPLIYMRGMKSDDLLAILDFLYCGETNVHQENLNAFLAVAEELQLKGLMGKSDKDEVKETFKTTPPKKVKPVHKKEPSALKPIGLSESYSSEQIEGSALDTLGGEGSLVSLFSSGDLQELDEKCNSMMEKTFGKNAHGQPLYRCNVCGKEEINGAIKSHIEANHLEGVSIPCNFCEKTFRSKNSLAMHTRRNHKGCRDNISLFSSSIF